ncbi:exopolysaccharide biosynthesis protein [Ciceribacter thiooxidans]|uniref:Exopolysaccharide biosynthesis protein n=1 Tax=Ciceribacter thiooxidans TaxID=1969821 RepID=A0ABV7HWT9_9HYPH|nr:exopolysaccharide biosynthesis protein [Ciceribacter thiooxidans]
MENATERMTEGADAVTAAFDHDGEGRPGEHLSRLLERLAQAPHERTTVGDVAVALQDRSFGAFLLIFALPNLVPAPPGATLVLGLPLAVVAWQMIASPHGRVVLPRWLGDYGVARSTFEKIVEKLVPSLRVAERLFGPRYWFLGSRFSERILGLYVLLLAVVVILPIPLGNWPPAFALAIIGFAHSERDGLGVLIGCLVGVVALLLAGFVVLTAGAIIALVF